ncbi:hypothetical protein CK203_107201 [Vitis vinifera]|uniref:Reverse transcriptase zinc-binding domain-containing protein n=1 Tax=Vitis vinifera TaxID=29760 RepID=A0A438DBP3_VITVI|nr:hypothetical protein CK203_107201 [Vitis vinifera]
MFGTGQQGGGREVGVLASLGPLMIGRWKRWRAFCYTCVPKVSFFTWEASWGKVLTLDQVKKRGQALANRCYFCQAEEESIDHHLLLHWKPYWVGTDSLWEKAAR